MTSKFNSLRTIPILKSQPPRKIVAIHVQEVAKKQTSMRYMYTKLRRSIGLTQHLNFRNPLRTNRNANRDSWAGNVRQRKASSIYE